MITRLKLDFSTEDCITPREIEYQYPLMFEKRNISVMAYYLETILAEKNEIIIARGTSNSRMRDFYDIYALLSIRISINEKHFLMTVNNTFNQKGSDYLIVGWKEIVKEVHQDIIMQQLWKSYQRKYDYAEGIDWDDIIEAVESLGTILTSKSNDLLSV